MSSAAEQSTPPAATTNGAPTNHEKSKESSASGSRPSTAPKETFAFELDVPKLHSLPSEQQDLYLLTFVSDVLRHVKTLEQDGITAEQVALKKEMFKILALPSPAPTRAIRTNVGKIFAEVLGRGNRSPLFETINELVAILGQGKGEKELRAKHAAAHVLGEVFAAAGDSAIQLSSLACASLLKAVKSSSNHAGLRATIYTALRKIVIGVGSYIDEVTAKEVWKSARNIVPTDKAISVQVSACRCMETLIKLTPYFHNSNDFDSLKNTIWKTIDSSTPAVRNAAASCLAAILIKSYSEHPVNEPVPKIKKPKKNAKRQSMAIDDEAEIHERSESPMGRKPAVYLALSLPDMLKIISTQYCRTSTNNRARAGLAVCYKHIVTGLPVKVIEEQFSQLAEHLLVDLLNNPTVTYNRYRQLMTRKFVKSILEDTVGLRILGESSQLRAAKWLINDVLKNYPQVIQERPEPNKHTLTSTLSLLSTLMSSLGSAVNAIGDSCKDALLQVLQHPSYTVQVHTAHALRSFVLACPQQLLSCVTSCMESLNKELTQLQSLRRCVGYANGLAAMLSTSRLQPLYGSVEVYSKVLTLATDLLKSSSSSELRVSATQIQVAWILIGGLMPLGPSFVKIHLNQLLLLWKNALPKPLPNQNLAQRAILETSFLTHVRECALGAMLVFLEFNSKLVTADGSKRITNMLQNTVQFLESLPTKQSIEEVSQRLSPSLQLHDYSTMTRRRVLQCFTKLVTLSNLGHTEGLSQSNLLGLAVASFADPDTASPKSLESSLSTFESVWETGDNWGYGVTGLVRGFEIEEFPGQYQRDIIPDWASSHSENRAIDDVLLAPVCRAEEHDSILLYAHRGRDEIPSSDPAMTGVVNAAVKLFAVAFPLQNPRIQESSLEQMATFLSSHTLQKNPGRKAAITVNIATATLGALKVAVKETSSAPGDLKSAATEKCTKELLSRFLADPDPIVRTIGAEAVGRLCNSSGNAVTSSEVKRLIDVIVENRDPSARAGCALALGCIHAQVGGMAAGFHLKTIVGVLLSLCNDTHPVVHFWALEALTKVAESAGLTFSGYVSSTLGMLAQLYVADTHNNESASLATSNAESLFSTPVVIGSCVDSLINVLGPDLQDMAKARDMIFTLVRNFQIEEDPALQIGSSRCLEHLSLYAPAHVEFAEYVRRLQYELNSQTERIRHAAINGLSNLMKRDAEHILNTAAPGLEDELWLTLDQHPGHPVLQSIIQNWLQQTALTNTEMWVQRCQSVLVKTRLKPEEIPVPKTTTATNAPELPDDEVAGFAAAAAGENAGDGGAGDSKGQELLKWQTRHFAMSCLNELLSQIKKEIAPDHTIPAEAALQSRIGDIVRMAFSASTAGVVELRIWGLKIIDLILIMFGKTPDPDFAEASLLEQYQAQIGSALTPAFAADSSPELAAEAVNVCASFVATGIVTNVDRMGRIFKLLVTALENFASDANTTSIGDLQNLTSNSRVMLKTAVFSAWAQLQVASSDQKYLVPIVQPYTAKLTPLWLESLQEFARLRFEPDISSTGVGPLSGDLDDVYSALNRETLLKFYQDSWLSLVDAIAALVEIDSEFVFDALDGKLDVSNERKNAEEEKDDEPKGKGNNINYRDEPVAFFFVLFGLAFEALVGHTRERTSQTLEILFALKKILRPSVSGNAIYQDAVFSETMDALARLALTEGSSVQTTVVEIARNLSLDHLSAKAGEDTNREESLSDDIEQLFELTRIIILVLAGLLPNLGESSPSSTRNSLASEDSLILIKLALDSLVSISAVFPSMIRPDLHVCILHIFTTILATGACQETIVPQILPTLKRFVQQVTAPSSGAQSAGHPHQSSPQMRVLLTRLLSILSYAQRRESETSLPCAKNTLLTLTILMTTSTNTLLPTDPLIPAILSEFTESLHDVGLAKVAAGCLRSILLLPVSSASDQVVKRILIPQLIAFVTGTGKQTSDPENVRPIIAQALVSTVPVLVSNPALGSDPAKTAAATMSLFTLLIPTLLQRAKREGESNPKVIGEIASRLLELAGYSQNAFRVVVGRMDAETREFLQMVLTKGRGLGRNGAEDEDEEDDSGAAQARNEPTIALRMDF